MPSIKSHKLRQHGDTIIEVMICMVLVGGALVTSFGIARRSLSQIRDSQERGEMLRIAEGQVEGIKQYIVSNTYAKFRTDVTPPAGFAAFCIHGTNKDTIQANITNPKDARCAVNEKGEFCIDAGKCNGATPPDVADNLGYPYRVATVYHQYHDGPPPPPSPEVNEFYTFAGRISASSASSNGQGNSVVTLFYRQHL